MFLVVYVGFVFWSVRIFQNKFIRSHTSVGVAKHNIKVPCTSHERFSEYVIKCMFSNIQAKYFDYEHIILKGFESRTAGHLDRTVWQESSLL